jgi:hypothetical protein
MRVFLLYAELKASTRAMSSPAFLRSAGKHFKRINVA